MARVKSKPISTDTLIEPPPRRYSLDGDERVEARIAEDQRRVAATVAELIPDQQFVALVLAGPYGRGEGAPIEIDAPDVRRLTNCDGYDYLVVVRKLRAEQRRRLARQLAGTAKRLGLAFGVNVHFRLLPWGRLRRAEPSLINAEMLWGNRVIAGAQKVLERMPAIPFAAVAVGELSRRMLDAGAGLLTNQQRLLKGGAGWGVTAFSEGDGLDGEQRHAFLCHLATATFACGDALLAINGHYHPSSPVKLERLERLKSAQPEAWVNWLGRGQDRFLELYRSAYRYQLHAEDSALGTASLADSQTGVRRLWLTTLQAFEGHRLGRAVRSWPEYCRAKVSKGQGSGVGPLRNLAITMRDFGLPNVLAEPRRALRSPRERYIAILPMLLNEVGQRPDPCVCAALGLPSDADWTQAVASFLRHWSADR